MMMTDSHFLMTLLGLAAGKQTVVDIMVMTDSFTVDMEKVRHSARLSQLAIRLVEVSTMLRRSSFSRKI